MDGISVYQSNLGLSENGVQPGFEGFIPHLPFSLKNAPDPGVFFLVKLVAASHSSFSSAAGWPLRAPNLAPSGVENSHGMGGW